jgi:hypothetical protein
MCGFLIPSVTAGTNKVFNPLIFLFPFIGVTASTFLKFNEISVRRCERIFLVYFEVQKHDPYKLGKICVAF